MFLSKGIKGIADLYYLHKEKDSFIDMERMGEKSVANLLASIENQKVIIHRLFWLWNKTYWYSGAQLLLK